MLSKNAIANRIANIKWFCVAMKITDMISPITSNTILQIRNIPIPVSLFLLFSVRFDITNCFTPDFTIGIGNIFVASIGINSYHSCG